MSPVTARIDLVHARRVWDGAGRPAIEVEVFVAGGARGRSIAPSGPAASAAEAHDLRDGGAAFGGLDVASAIAGVDGEIDRALRGLDAADQEAVDRRLVTLDATPGKSRLGGNAIVATSMAAAQAAAAAQGVPLWRHLAQGREPVALPLPRVEIVGADVGPGEGADLASVQVIAIGAEDYGTALDWAAEVYRTAGALLAHLGSHAGVAGLGGHRAALENGQQALELVVRAIERSGFTPGEDMALAIDVGASRLGRGGQYALPRQGRRFDSAGLCELLLGWLGRFPIVALEDPLGVDDTQGMIRLTRAAGSGVEIAGGDFLGSDARKIRLAHEIGACNAALITPGRVGTLTEAREAVEMAHAAGWSTIAAARPGDSEDVSIMHLAVGWGIEQLKAGGFSRTERVAKWNEGLRLAEELPGGGRFAHRERLRW